MRAQQRGLWRQPSQFRCAPGPSRLARPTFPPRPSPGPTSRASPTPSDGQRSSTAPALGSSGRSGWRPASGSLSLDGESWPTAAMSTRRHLRDAVAVTTPSVALAASAATQTQPGALSRGSGPDDRHLRGRHLGAGGRCAEGSPNATPQRRRRPPRASRYAPRRS